MPDSFGELTPGDVAAFTKGRLAGDDPLTATQLATAALTTVLSLRDLVTGMPGSGVNLQIAFWLWVCVLFANFYQHISDRNCGGNTIYFAEYFPRPRVVFKIVGIYLVFYQFATFN